jgi:hypothetical protein
MTSKQIREEFRRFLKAYKIAEGTVIDKNGFTEFSFMTGCFRVKPHEWIVYDTDERTNVVNCETFKSQIEAYREVAARNNLEEEFLEFVKDNNLK